MCSGSSLLRPSRKRSSTTRRAIHSKLKNLAGDPQHATKLGELRGALDEWLKKTDDKGAIPVEQLVARGIITERAEKYAERVQRGAEAVKEELKK
jgi:hypothetical protein